MPHKAESVHLKSNDGDNGSMLCSIATSIKLLQSSLFCFVAETFVALMLTKPKDDSLLRFFFFNFKERVDISL